MKDRLLLISHDAALAQRVQMLVQRLSVDLHWRPHFEPPSGWAGALIVLLDEDCLPPDDAAGGMEEDEIVWGESQATTLLLVSQGARSNAALRLGFRDILHKDQRLSHLPWVLQEHLNTLRLQRARQRQEREDVPDLDPTVFSLRHEVNNPLSGILGNAELALASKGKLPPDVRERLERIVHLAMQIRELLHTRGGSDLAASGGTAARLPESQPAQ